MLTLKFGFLLARRMDFICDGSTRSAEGVSEYRQFGPTAGVSSLGVLGELLGSLGSVGPSISSTMSGSLPLDPEKAKAKSKLEKSRSLRLPVGMLSSSTASFSKLGRTDTLGLSVARHWELSLSASGSLSEVAAAGPVGQGVVLGASGTSLAMSTIGSFHNPARLLSSSKGTLSRLSQSMR